MIWKCRKTRRRSLSVPILLKNFSRSDESRRKDESKSNYGKPPLKVSRTPKEDSKVATKFTLITDKNERETDCVFSVVATVSQLQ